MISTIAPAWYKSEGTVRKKYGNSDVSLSSVLVATLLIWNKIHVCMNTLYEIRSLTYIESIYYNLNAYLHGLFGNGGGGVVKLLTCETMTAGPNQAVASSFPASKSRYDWNIDNATYNSRNNPTEPWHVHALWTSKYLKFQYLILWIRFWKICARIELCFICPTWGSFLTYFGHILGGWSHMANLANFTYIIWIRSTSKIKYF